MHRVFEALAPGVFAQPGNPRPAASACCCCSKIVTIVIATTPINASAANTAILHTTPLFL
jgi:hypothetical protein